MEDVLVFVDDGFFGLVKKYFQKEDGKTKRYLQTFRNICKKEGLNLKHLYVYTAPPYQSPRPTEKEDFLMSKYQKMTKMLRKKNWITLREGRLQKVIASDGKINFNQKGVDVLLTIDLSHIKEDYPDIKKIILVSSDTDFCPAIKDIKKRNKIEVILYTYFDRKRRSKFSLSNELIEYCSEYVRLLKEETIIKKEKEAEKIKNET